MNNMSCCAKTYLRSLTYDTRAAILQFTGNRHKTQLITRTKSLLPLSMSEPTSAAAAAVVSTGNPIPVRSTAHAAGSVALRKPESAMEPPKPPYVDLAPILKNRRVRHDTALRCGFPCVCCSPAPLVPEKELPALPLPSLEQTCRRFIEVAAGVLTLEELESTKEEVAKFQSGDGARLDAILQQWKPTEDNRSYIEK